MVPLSALTALTE